MSTHLSIAALVPAYVSPPVPYTKAKAVRCIVEMRLGSRNARGKGNKAKRRSHPVCVHSLPLGLPRE